MISIGFIESDKSILIEHSNGGTLTVLGEMFIEFLRTPMESIDIFKGLLPGELRKCSKTDYDKHQKKLLKMCYYCLDIDGPEAFKKLNINERFHLYKQTIDTDNYKFIFKSSYGFFDQSSKFVEMVQVEDGLYMFYYEFFKMIIYNIQLKKCSYCGNYFIINDRPTALYCEVIEPNSGQPCNVIGPRKVYESSLKEDSVMMFYRKEYNRKNARIRLAKNKMLEKETFKNWASEAKEMKNKYQNKEISSEEFETWLKES